MIAAGNCAIVRNACFYYKVDMETLTLKRFARTVYSGIP